MFTFFVFYLLTNFSPIGHMRISPPEGGIVAGNYVPGNVS
jgi:hypothetical protein